MTILNAFKIMAKTKQKDIIYRGRWDGIGEMYDIRVGSLYTTIVVKPGENIEERWKQTMARFDVKQSP